MTVTVIPDEVEGGAPGFRAIAGDREASGPTVGAALDRLNALVGDAGPEADDPSSTLIVVQRFRPDRFFTAEQQGRLAELMGRWRAARDAGAALPPEEQTELDALVQAELQGMADRGQALLDGRGK